MKNKSSYFIIPILCFITNMAWAQNAFYEGMTKHLSFRVGYANTTNNTSITNFTGNDFGNRISGLYLGFETGLYLNKNIQLFGGIQTLNKGVKSGFEIRDNNNKLISKLNYRYTLTCIEIPIYYKYHFKKFVATCGFDLSYLMRANFIAEFADPSAKQYYLHANDITEKFNAFDCGILIGVEKQILPHVSLELLLQKNLIRPYKTRSDELNLQQTLFLGLKYQIFN
jgi:hypothetical protein